MHIPAFSVLIPSTGNVAYLRRAIASLGAQSMPDWECIVIVDGAPAAALVEPWFLSLSDPRFRLLTLKENQGVGPARNAVAKLARAPLLAFLDHDDFWFPDKLEQHFTAHNSNPEAGLVFSDVYSWWQEGILPVRREFLKPSPRGLPYDALKKLELCIHTPSSMTMRTDDFHRAGGFGTGAEDLELYLRISQFCRFIHLAVPLTVYCYSTSGSLSSRNDSLLNLTVLASEHGLAGSMHRRFISVSAHMRVKSLIAALHQQPRHRAVLPFLMNFLKTYKWTQPKALLRMLLIASIPFGLYRFIYARKCRPQDSLEVAALLKSIQS